MDTLLRRLREICLLAAVDFTGSFVGDDCGLGSDSFESVEQSVPKGSSSEMVEAELLMLILCFL